MAANFLMKNWGQEKQISKLAVLWPCRFNVLYSKCASAVHIFINFGTHSGDMCISNANKVRKSILPIFTQCLLTIQVSKIPCHCAWTDAKRSTGTKLGLCLCTLSCFSCVRLCEALRTSPCQTPLSMGFSRQDYWSGLPCPLSGHLPDPGIEPSSLMSSALGGRFFTTSAMTMTLNNVLSFLPPWLSSLNPWPVNTQSRWALLSKRAGAYHCLTPCSQRSRGITPILPSRARPLPGFHCLSPPCLDQDWDPISLLRNVLRPMVPPPSVIGSY